MTKANDAIIKYPNGGKSEEIKAASQRYTMAVAEISCKVLSLWEISTLLKMREEYEKKRGYHEGW